MFLIFFIFILIFYRYFFLEEIEAMKKAEAERNRAKKERELAEQVGQLEQMGFSKEVCFLYHHNFIIFYFLNLTPS